MSGTEAVMQAVRLARYHTGRSHLVRFCGAYHGWWGDVQPGIGNPLPPRETYTLKDMSEQRCSVLRTRRTSPACWSIRCRRCIRTPVRPAIPSLVDSSRRADFDRAAYAAWLQQLREVCTERGIVLIFDEVFVGFRLAPGGAQEYFGVRADMVTYGKTLGGGLPVGVVCGRKRSDAAFSRRPPGRHLLRARHLQFASLRDGGDAGVSGAARDAGCARPLCRPRRNLEPPRGNAQCAARRRRGCRCGWPIFPRSGRSIYTQPGRYNWMLQYYLRAEGLALSWVGTGRLIFSLNYDEADFAAVADRFVAAAAAMERDGWWWRDAAASPTRRSGAASCVKCWRIGWALRRSG